MWTIVALVVAALIIGISKTSVGGLAAISVALFALVMPTKESTAAVLLLLVVGDIVAVARYRHHCDWSLLKRLLPWVLPGLALGAVFMHYVDDVILRRSIGALLGIMVAIQLIAKVRAGKTELPENPTPPHPVAATGAGLAAGFTTMTANAAGPVMTLYLLAAGVTKHAFIGTGAWYFLLINLTKIPFSAALHLFPASTLRLDLMLAPLVLLGTLIGIQVTKRLSQRAFDLLALGSSVIAAVALIVR